uniref:Secreted protein n=1 Tax=Globodera pallida TaxID=36090 RepID=A0A183CCQ1_GLOPA
MKSGRDGKMKAIITCYLLQIVLLLLTFESAFALETTGKQIKCYEEVVHSRADVSDELNPPTCFSTTNNGCMEAMCTTFDGRIWGSVDRHCVVNGTEATICAQLSANCGDGFVLSYCQICRDDYCNGQLAPSRVSNSSTPDSTTNSTDSPMASGAIGKYMVPMRFIFLYGSPAKKRHSKNLRNIAFDASIILIIAFVLGAFAVKILH